MSNAGLDLVAACATTTSMILLLNVLNADKKQFLSLCDRVLPCSLAPAILEFTMKIKVASNS